METRHGRLGIKQTLRLEWLQQTVALLLAGLSTEAIRRELHEILAGSEANTAEGTRSDTNRTFIVNNLMNIWVSPAPDLGAFRDASLAIVEKYPALHLAAHWGMIAAAYPFWFNVARQTGRLLALQEQVTQLQIVNRLKEQYGDRQTVSRYARFVIRSFVAWGVLRDSPAKGCYTQSAPLRITEIEPAVLLLESALHAAPEASGAVEILLHTPALFPFQLPLLNGARIAHHTSRITVVSHGLHEELLILNPV